MTMTTIDDDDDDDDFFRTPLRDRLIPRDPHSRESKFVDADFWVPPEFELSDVVNYPHHSPENPETHPRKSGRYGA